MLNKDRLYWTLQIGGWLFYAGVQIVGSSFAFGQAWVSPVRMVFFVAEALLCLVLTHLFRIKINEWRWLNYGMQRLIPRIVLSVFVLALLVYVGRLLISMPLGMYNAKVLFNPITVISFTIVYAVIFFLWSVLYFIYNYFERYNNSLKLEASVREIELNNLKSQLNPHFIFNALNSIRALVDENPLKSKQAINQLSNILRSSLATGKKGLTPFEDELKIVKDYIGLEQIRFEERLHVEFEIAEESLDFLVPPLMIQTLVENGIKHGISKLTSGGVIQLTTKVHDDRLNIQVRNSGVYFDDQKKSGNGVGLENTIHRLKLIYGDEALFKISTEKNNFVLVEVEIPHIYG